MNGIISIACIAVFLILVELLARNHDRKKKALQFEYRKETYDAPYVFNFANADFRFIELYTPNAQKCADPNYRFDGNGFRLDSRNIHLSKEPSSDQVWMFGGSTMLGLCVKEDETIPAHLNRLLELDASPTRVLNMGCGGFSSTNELLLLVELLQAGYRPRGIVVYNGINENPSQRYFKKWHKHSYAAEECRRIRTGTPQSLKQFRREIKVWFGANIRAINFIAGLKRTPARTVTADKKVSTGSWQAVIEQYVRNLLMMKGICDAYGVFSIFCFQPVLQYEVHYNIRQFSEYESTKLIPHCRTDEVERRETLYRCRIDDLRRRFGEDFVDLYDVFRGHDGERLYDDPRHQNGKANKILANEIYKYLSQRLPSQTAAPGRISERTF